ncbi:MAG: mandelate racemase/muconate lactonizing enzyme family protein [Deltaproteobacteria bacterium]
MKIQDVESFPVSYQLDRPFANSAERHQRRSTTLVKITSDEGIVGWGEAYGPPAGVSRLIQTYLKPRLIGQDPFRMEYLWFKIQMHKGIPRGAMGGIDLALWDLKARALNVPVYELLGGLNTEVITPYATGFFFSEDDPDSTKYLEAEAAVVLSNKFRALKMKIGFGKDRDIRRMKRVRELVSDKVDMMVDANQAYDLMTCLELVPCLTDLKVRWLEEPMPWHSFEGYKELRKKVPFAIAGGEAENDYRGFVEAIREHVVDVIQPDLAASGGLTNARRVAIVADAFQVDFQPHVFGTVLALPAVVQLIASITNNQPWMLFPRPVFLEWDTTTNPMATDLLKNPLQLTDGVLPVPKGVGIGVEVNEEAIKHYLIE